MSHDQQAIAARLRRAGYRVTPQRKLILDAVCGHGGHVTAEEVLAAAQAAAPNLNPATVYRALHFLTEQEILTASRSAAGRESYELAGPEPHHHLVCRSCGRWLEIPQSDLRHFRGQIAAGYDFEIEMRHITFFGRCARCRLGRAA
ncbi:MAG: Fur family transcriptional regulator [Candidatus Promineifilaceae bacterium]